MDRMFFMHVDYLLKVENKICFGFFFQHNFISQKHEAYLEEKQETKKAKKPRSKKSVSATVSTGLDVEEDSNMD